MRRRVSGWTSTPQERSTATRLTVATFNIWFDSHHAEERYLAIADLLGELTPDVIALQEVTPAALDIFSAQPWVRDEYVRAAMVGGDIGNYGMLMLSRMPVVPRRLHPPADAPVARIPSGGTRGRRSRQVVCCLHLDSGKSSARLRGWQLRRIFRTLRTAERCCAAWRFQHA